MTRPLPLALALILLAGVGGSGRRAAAQRIADRVAAAPGGVVRFSFAARDGVCGNGRTVIALDCENGACGRRTITMDGWKGDEVEYDCEPGPVRVSLTVRGGRADRLRTYVGGRWVVPRPGAAVTDLGTVPARDAVQFFLDLALHDSSRTGEEAVFPAVLGDSVEVWPDLIRLAKNDRVPHRTRRQAVFWLGQAAGDRVTGELAGLADNETVDRDVKEQAVFALSQQAHAVGIPALIRIARANRDREVRRKALFWLGQSDDPRALALFEELLTKP